MYQALYRKYRPSEFNDVVGQEVIINTLKNAIKFNHISHAYLFAGPRGTGKTTVAKIFARAVNCMDPVDGLACGKCKNCLYSFSKECMDIIEIDAASNNGVDEIRELRNKVSILPSELKYKVYIIDEVHMLSLGAFNALLKTIEEPPGHVIFILATTDPQKIPTTIISRCQNYSFKKIALEEIVSRLKTIASKEKIDIENEVLIKIAEAADGGLRDAIGLLDKLRTYCTNNKILINDFFEINGEINSGELREFEHLIFSCDIQEVLKKLEQYYQDGKNLIQIMKQLMLLIKDELFAYYIDNKEINYDASMMIDFLNLLNTKINDIKKSDDVKLAIEIVLLYYLKEINNKTDNASLKEKKEVNKIPLTDADNNKLIDKSLEKEVIEECKPVIDEKNSSMVDMDNFKKLMEIRSKNTMVKATKEELNKEVTNFKRLEDFTFDQNYGYLVCEILDGKVRASSKDSLIISYDYESMIEKISTDFNKLTEVYSNLMNENKQIAVITNETWVNLRKEYIDLKSKGLSFELTEEPILNNENNNVKINKTDEVADNFIADAIELFGNIVEVE